MENYYRVLGLENFASPEEIKVSYRKLAKRYHPDVNQANKSLEEQFKHISKAYQILSNADAKARLDMALRGAPYQKKPVYHYYTRQKRTYTPTAWMFAKIFIIVLMMIAVLGPITLIYQASVKSYEKGISAYEMGNYEAAVLELNRAIRQFGGRSVKASIKGSEIAIFNLKDYKQGLYFASNGLSYAEQNHEIAQLLFLHGLCLLHLNVHGQACEDLKRSLYMGHTNAAIVYREFCE